MQPESKVVSMDTAQKLIDAGFVYDTERFWVQLDTPEQEWVLRNDIFGGGIATKGYIIAPDAQEIGELLPMDNIECHMTVLGTVARSKGKWCCLFGEDVRTKQYGDNEAEARAACWLYLKQQGII